ncbi:RING/U-box superfamily protein [Raphanus sativus]|uniref:RING-type E3 ubiquitin transferase n=1 Tax=Raphanus sativus TaxID=3726 RepID=A0A6J0KGD3_RAPSA|nr:probable E3 ubiquitin-protein ligase RHB1A isoform X1 [Raphanus sativus]XP_018446959.1 probable E3 ubiquitin-protein ligase RHB1A isoform X1 [Raphanus sativus]XP_018446960.1 probable E3 ubiquitin-protein ligase RHB1A isoform X1 [Raphanus sativus]KAJ4885313.1 RING/U-box superfamily protein [Raphanus sativus]
MGGCCCCSSRRADLHNAPPYYYYPRATEERVPLSSAHTISSGVVVVVDTNLETSSPDAYIPPPLPTPFDVAIGVPQTPGNAEGTACFDIREVSVETANTVLAHGTVDGITLGVPTTCPCKETESKLQTEIEDIDPKKLSKDVFVPVEEEEDCPICLEEYDMENPKLVAKCEHHFHLACILEWIERSETCPVCNKEMVFDSPLD